MVADASAAVAALLGSHTARTRLSTGPIHAPHLIDFEIVSALRRAASHGDVSDETATAALDVWREITIGRHGSVGLLARIWELRNNLTPYDAGYVALAEALGCPLVTTDGHLARAPGLRCDVHVLPE